MPYEHFKKRLHGQAGFEGCLLLRTSPQGISKIYSISMGWKTLQVPLPLLRPESCTKNIHDIVESVSNSIEKVEYTDHNQYRRHINNRSNQKGGGVNQGHSHLHFGTFRFFSQFKEICASTMSGNRISGPYSKFCESDSLSLPLQNVQKVQEECKNWTSILKLTKLLGFLSSTIQAVVPARLQIRNLQQLQIQSLELKKSFQMNVKLTGLAKEELLWWMSNLQHSNGKLCIQNHLGQVLIQTDASKKRLGSSMQRSSNWGFVFGTTPSYQCPGTSSNKTSFFDIHQVRII